MHTPRLLAMLTTLAFSFSALAQCPATATFGSPELPGLNGRQITAMLDWDPDGPGPLPSVLLVSGDFTLAGSVAAAGMATWDGSAWHAFPAPLASVNALTTLNGDLIAAPANANPAPVVRWNAATSSWVALGSLPAPVNALAIFNNQLYAGGTSNGSGPLTHWNGSTWVLVLPFTSNTTVNALYVHNNLLYLGGSFPGGVFAASFDGSSFFQYPALCDSCSANCFATHNGSLYMGITGSQPLKVLSGSSWQNVFFNVFGSQTAIYAMNSYAGDLYFAGNFSTSFNGQETNNLARLHNGAWQQVNPYRSCRNTVRALTQFRGNLILGTGIGGELCSPVGVTAFQNGTFSSLTAGLDGTIATAANFNGSTVYAGTFRSANGATLNDAGLHQGGVWTPLADGPGLSCGCSIVLNNNLYVAGYNYGPEPLLLPIRQWNGTAWSSLGLSTLNGTNISGLVSFRGDLIAYGGFTPASATTAHNIARWDGSAWHALGSILQAEVYTATVCNDRLIAGGQLSQFGYFASWDGSTWQPLGNALNYWPSSSCTYRGNVIAAGSFTASGATPLNHIARFDGAAWQPLGPGFSGGVRGLAEYDHRLFLLGQLPGAPYHGVLLAWDGQSWTDVTPPALVGVLRPAGLAVLDTRLLIFDSTYYVDSGGYGVIEFTQSCGPVCGSADFNGDGDVGTDTDIDAFFACLGGNCCAACGSTDFNDDGDLGTDQDIEAFFRVLAGGSC